MSVLVEAGDVLQIAMRIEENGANFYRYAVQIAPEEDAKKMFADLAVEEDKHKAWTGWILRRVFPASMPPT